VFIVTYELSFSVIFLELVFISRPYGGSGC